jgi:hypothetical protein
MVSDFSKQFLNLKFQARGTRGNWLDFETDLCPYRQPLWVVYST